MSPDLCRVWYNRRRVFVALVHDLLFGSRVLPDQLAHHSGQTDMMRLAPPLLLLILQGHGQGNLATGHGLVTQFYSKVTMRRAPLYLSPAMLLDCSPPPPRPPLPDYVWPGK
jgi:hypothetical protein